MATVAPIAAFLAAAVAGGFAGPLIAQVKRVPVVVGARQLGVGFLPAAPDSFDLVVRATGDLLKARVVWTRTAPATEEGTATSDTVVWSRPLGVAAKEASFRVSGLTPASEYQFVFSLFRKPTGNESRQIEAFALDTVRGVFAAAPTMLLESLLPLLSRALDSSVRRVLPATTRPDTTPTYPRDTAQLHEALKIRLVDRLHDAYRKQARLVADLDTVLIQAQDRAPTKRLAAVTAAIREQVGAPELHGPALACNSVSKKTSVPDLARTAEDGLLEWLRAIHQATSDLSACRGLLRDLRLERYRSVGKQLDGLKQIADELLPVSARLEELKAALEELVAIWRRRDGAIRQVSQDLRRAAEASIRAVDSFAVAGRTAPQETPSTVAGLGLAATVLPCVGDNTCFRVVPNATIGLRLSGRGYLDLGLTLASTAASGRTRHLFWFSSLLIGPSYRLGTTPGRLGIGVVILRGDVDRLGAALKFGGYLNLTLVDFRL